MSQPCPCYFGKSFWAVVLADITSEAEELCSKPQEEAKVPTMPTLELECVSPNGLTNEQVWHWIICTNNTWNKSLVLHSDILEVIVMCKVTFYGIFFLLFTFVLTSWRCVNMLSKYNCVWNVFYIIGSFKSYAMSKQCKKECYLTALFSLHSASLLAVIKTSIFL